MFQSVMGMKKLYPSCTGGRGESEKTFISRGKEKFVGETFPTKKVLLGLFFQIVHFAWQRGSVAWAQFSL